jgi:hypothetical protein
MPIYYQIATETLLFYAFVLSPFLILIMDVIYGSKPSQHAEQQWRQFTGRLMLFQWHLYKSMKTMARITGHELRTTPPALVAFESRYWTALKNACNVSAQLSVNKLIELMGNKQEPEDA